MTFCFAVLCICCSCCSWHAQAASLEKLVQEIKSSGSFALGSPGQSPIDNEIRNLNPDEKKRLAVMLLKDASDIPIESYMDLGIIRAFGILAHVEAVPLLIDALKVVNQQFLPETAAEALANMGGDAKAAVPILARLLMSNAESDSAAMALDKIFAAQIEAMPTTEQKGQFEIYLDPKRGVEILLRHEGEHLSGIWSHPLHHQEGKRGTSLWFYPYPVYRVVPLQNITLSESGDVSFKVPSVRFITQDVALELERNTLTFRGKKTGQVISGFLLGQAKISSPMLRPTMLVAKIQSLDSRSQQKLWQAREMWTTAAMKALNEELACRNAIKRLPNKTLELIGAWEGKDDEDPTITILKAGSDYYGLQASFRRLTDESGGDVHKPLKDIKYDPLARKFIFNEGDELLLKNQSGSKAVFAGKKMRMLKKENLQALETYWRIYKTMTADCLLGYRAY